MIVARAPNHLGDGVMALPAIHALSRLGELVIAAPRWGRELYRDVPATVIPRGTLPACDAAVLFSPSFRAAWQARRAKRRIGTPSDHRRWLLTDVVRPGLHQRETYARLAAVLGAHVTGDPTYPLRADDPQVEVPAAHVGLNPVSVSGPVREWPGFAAFAARVPGPVVVYGGPGEEARVLPLAAGHPTRIGLSLPAFAQALSRCRCFVSNDSGAAHFARACGVRTLVIYGSTSPEHSGPAGAEALVGRRPFCAPCRGSWCPYDRECFRVSPDDVLDRLS